MFLTFSMYIFVHVYIFLTACSLQNVYKCIWLNFVQWLDHDIPGHICKHSYTSFHVLLFICLL